MRFISGVGKKGPACFLIEAEGKRLLLDLGEGPPPGCLPQIEGLGRVDALVLSHGHRDHVGGLSLLPQIGNPPVYGTGIVARGLPKDIAARALPAGGMAEIMGIPIETGRNGHAPGGIWLRFAIGDGFLYTGDYSAESALYAYDPPQSRVATALIDCSYGAYQKPLAECWNTLAPFVERGPLLLPAPANGRGPDIALELMRHGFDDIFTDDATRDAVQRLRGSDSISARRVSAARSNGSPRRSSPSTARAASCLQVRPTAHRARRRGFSGNSNLRPKWRSCSPAMSIRPRRPSG